MRPLGAPWVCFPDPEALSLVPRGKGRGNPWICWGHLTYPQKLPPCNKSSASACPGQRRATTGKKKESWKSCSGGEISFQWTKASQCLGFPGLEDLDPSFPQRTLGQVLLFIRCPLLLPSVLPVCWTRNPFHHQMFAEPQLEPRAPEGYGGSALKIGHGLVRQGWPPAVLSIFWAKELPHCGSFLKNRFYVYML